MSGTTAELIPIVIVPVVILVFWLGMMFYVNSHPQWGGQARADTVSMHALAGSVPAQRLSGPDWWSPASVRPPPGAKPPPSSLRSARPRENSVLTYEVNEPPWRDVDRGRS